MHLKCSESWTASSLMVCRHMVPQHDPWTTSKWPQRYAAALLSMAEYLESLHASSAVIVGGQGECGTL